MQRLCFEAKNRGITSVVVLQTVSGFFKKHHYHLLLREGNYHGFILQGTLFHPMLNVALFLFPFGSFLCVLLNCAV